MKRVEVTPDLALDDLLRQAQSEDIVLMREGHPVALLSELDDDELYWFIRESDPQFKASIAEAREQVKAGKTITHAELKRELGL